ncbi:H+ symporter family protein [Rhodococcus sp. MTM3W5.2]|nr:H+ symporter family protein [Rhodococcus sp. MTM3W5.2]
MSETTSPPRDPKADHGFFGQPVALANLFGVEMWERFSFYGMQGILIYYLYYSVADGGLGISQAAATSIVGAYGGTVYLSTILGGWIADRILGSERTLFYSAILVMCGHIALAVIPGLAGVGVGLIAIAVGSGGLKANATSLVGDLYAENDDRRDAGFSIFYMGINLGALIGPLLTGWAQKEWGFHVGFALAAIGMALGLIQYTLGRKRLAGIGERPLNPMPHAQRLRYAALGTVAILAILVLCLIGLITTDNLSDVVVGLTIVASITYFLVILTSKKITSTERSRVIAFIPMFLASAAFWSLFQQQFTVVAIYSDKRLDRNLFGWDFPASWVQSINPVFIIIFAGVFAAIWTKLGPRQPSSPLKFAAGTIIMGLAFLAFLPFAGGGPNSTPCWA